MSNLGYTYKLNKDLEESTVSAVVEVSAEKYNEVIEQTYKKLSADVKITGFRAGKAPKQMIIAKLGTKLINESLSDLLPLVAAEIVTSEELNPITNLNYTFPDAENKEVAVTFAFDFINYPTVKLADLSKIKVTIPAPNVTNEDVDKVLTRLFHDELYHKEGHEHDHHDHPEIDLSQITSEQIEKIGLPGITTMDALRTEVKSKLLQAKEQDKNGQIRDNAIEQAIKLSNVKLPEKYIQQRLDQEMHSYEHRILDLGIDLDTFLTAQGKTMEDIKNERRDQIVNDIGAELIINQIAKDYNLLPSTQDVDAEIANLQDPESKVRASTSEGRRQVMSAIIQQRGVSKLLELVKVD